MMVHSTAWFLACSLCFCAGIRVSAQEKADTVPLAKTAPIRLEGHQKKVTTLAFSPDGSILASGALDGMVILWDVARGKELRRWKAHDPRVYSLAFSPDGKALVSAGSDKAIRFWDPGTGNKTRQLEGHTDQVAVVAFSPDAKLLASGGYDKTIRLWNSTTGTVVNSCSLEAGRVTSLAFSPDGIFLASGGVVTEKLQMGGGNFATDSSDYVRLWNVGTLKKVQEFEAKGSTISFCADGKTIIASGLIAELRPIPGATAVDGIKTVSFINAHSGKTTKRIRWRGSATAASPDGSLFASAMGDILHFDGAVLGGDTSAEQPDPRLCLWEICTGKELLRFPEDKIAAVSINPTGNIVIGGSFTGPIFGWNIIEATIGLENRLVADDLPRLFEVLTTENSPLAHRTVCQLASKPDITMAYFISAIKPARAPTQEEVRGLIASLDSPDFRTRDLAMEQLKKLGKGIETEALRLLEGNPSGELRRNLDLLVQTLGTRPLASEEQRSMRVIRILELIGSLDAQRLLEILANGSPYALQTQTAHSALARLKKRPT